jgi:hypothetical protein
VFVVVSDPSRSARQRAPAMLATALAFGAGEPNHIAVRRPAGPITGRSGSLAWPFKPCWPLSRAGARSSSHAGFTPAAQRSGLSQAPTPMPMIALNRSVVARPLPLRGHSQVSACPPRPLRNRAPSLTSKLVRLPKGSGARQAGPLLRLADAGLASVSRSGVRPSGVGLHRRTSQAR